MKKTYIIAEIGINHNGSLDTAKKLIDVAAVAGCDAVKFQKRNPDKMLGGLWEFPGGIVNKGEDPKIILSHN